MLEKEIAGSVCAVTEQNLQQMCYLCKVIKVKIRWHGLLIWLFSAARSESGLWDEALRLVLVSFQSHQRNEPLAAPSANTDEGRLAFTESTLEAVVGLSVAHVWLWQSHQCVCLSVAVVLMSRQQHKHIQTHTQATKEIWYTMRLMYE